MFTRKSISIISSVLFLIVMMTGNASAQPLNFEPSPAKPLQTGQNVVSLTTDICTSVTQIPLTECQALEALYNSTNGTSWTNNTNWLQTNTPCSSPWYGVTCVSSHVTSLDLDTNQLIGSIPYQLGSLSYLQYLYLYNNQLSGSIPTQLGSLTNLTDLDLDTNQLSGSIPTQLGNLTNLQYLNLNGNLLSGSIPSELGNLTNLTNLHLGNNQLSGSIPSQLGNLTNLIYLHLSDNQLSGSIPDLSKLTNLKDLQLLSNQLSGTIPTWLGSLTKLQWLFLQINQLSGSIPPELGNLTNVQYLFLNDNLLSGSIPSQLGSLTNLTELALFNNQLSGSIPSQLGSLTSLTSLYLYNNQLSGSIPYQLGSLTYLQSLYLYNNQLSGSIPSQLGSLTNLTDLELNNNQLSGSLPVSLESLTKLQYFFFNNTSLCEPSDAAFQTWLSSIPHMSGTNICTFVVNVSVGGTNQGTYSLPEGSSMQQSYAGINNGPVQVAATTSTPIIASERLAWAVNGATSSIAEMLGLPSTELTNSYTFAWYNDATMDTQLRIGNVGASSTNVTVTIAGTSYGPYTITPNQSIRESYAGVNNGPVTITGSDPSVPIIATERLGWEVNGVYTSIAEMLGLPSNQLTNSYTFAWYNDATMDTQFRIGNVGASSTNVTVTIAGTSYGPYTIAPNQSIRESYAGSQHWTGHRLGFCLRRADHCYRAIGLGGQWHLYQHHRNARSAFQPVDQQLHLRLVQRPDDEYPVQNRKCRRFQHQCHRHHRWHFLWTLCHCTQPVHSRKLFQRQHWTGHRLGFCLRCTDHCHRAAGLGSQWHLHQHCRNVGSAFQPVDQQLYLRLVQRPDDGYPAQNRCAVNLSALFLRRSQSSGGCDPSQPPLIVIQRIGYVVLYLPVRLRALQKIQT